MMNPLKLKRSSGAALVAASSLASGMPASTARAQEQAQTQPPTGSLTLTSNAEGTGEARAQISFGQLTFAGEVKLSTNSLETPDQVLIGGAWQNGPLRFDAAYQKNKDLELVRLGYQHYVTERLQIGASTALGADTRHLAGFFKVDLSERFNFGVAADSDGDFRARALLNLDKGQAALSVGSQDGKPIVDGSFNTDNFWLLGRFQERSSLLRFAVGDIDIDRSDKALAFTGRGSLDPSLVPDPTGPAPVGLDLGESPSFLYGGRSPNTFLGREAGNKALMAQWHNQAGVSIEGAVRLGDSILEQSYFNAGVQYDINNKKFGALFEVGGSKGPADISVRGGVRDIGGDQEEFFIGPRVSIRF